jgi:AraC-like DNA-binding protein
MPNPSDETRKVLRRVRSSLAEIVVVSLQPGFTAHRTTCPDGQFWLPARGEQVVEGSPGIRRQRPFELLYYAPREPAVRVTDSPTLAYGLRLMLSRMNADEHDAAWYQSRPSSWDDKRVVLRLIRKGLESGGHALDEEVAQWIAQPSATPSESHRAGWLRRAEDLLHHDPSLSLLELSRAAGVVPAYLSAEFSRARGITISTYRRRIMLDRALASAERNSLNESAIEAGFYDASHFHRACVAELDLKPSMLRRMIWPT